MADHFQFCADHLREFDYGRYINCLYLDHNMRNAAFAIYAFNAKINQIPKLIGEPVPGEIRLQWWRDIVENPKQFSGDPIARSLQETIINFDLPPAIFTRLLDARIFDLYNDAMSDKHTFETYLGETRSSLFMLLELVWSKVDENSYRYLNDKSIANHAARDRSDRARDVSIISDACGHGGVFVGVVELLKELAFNHYRKQCYFPAQLSAHDLILDAGARQLKVNQLWLDEIYQYALQHFLAANHAIYQLPLAARPIFSGLVLAKFELEAMIKRNIKNDTALSSIHEPHSNLRINWCYWNAVRILKHHRAS